MVFTVPMEPRPAQGYSRRGVLTTMLCGAAGLTLSGCWGADRSAPPKPHPLASTLAGALALLDQYQATVATYADLGDQLQPLLSDHRAHIDAVRRAMGIRSPAAGPSPSASASAGVPSDPAAALTALQAAEKAGQDEATGACLAAPPEHAALIGSIAACRATHVEVLGS
jgi:hypothetical protein